MNPGKNVSVKAKADDLAMLKIKIYLTKNQKNMIFIKAN
jgi:hypothetical protein